MTTLTEAVAAANRVLRAAGLPTTFLFPAPRSSPLYFLSFLPPLCTLLPSPFPHIPSPLSYSSPLSAPLPHLPSCVSSPPLSSSSGTTLYLYTALFGRTVLVGHLCRDDRHRAGRTSNVSALV